MCQVKIRAKPIDFGTHIFVQISVWYVQIFGMATFKHQPKSHLWTCSHCMHAWGPLPVGVRWVIE
jgi:hypothetical protein